MAQSYDYDAIVIGAGIAGMVSAVTANGLGKRVAVTAPTSPAFPARRSFG
jgi:succinate dehydrogenase/fumarate reductase flavoprotein subunit